MTDTPLQTRDPELDVIEAQIVAMLESKAFLAQEAAKRLSAEGKSRKARDQYAAMIALSGAALTVKCGHHRTYEVRESPHE